MNMDDLKEAEAEAKRFLERVKRYKMTNPKVLPSGEISAYNYSRERAAMLRSSLDLSIALPKLRRSR